MITAIISAIIVGAIVGALARLILPGRQNISMVMTIGVGIVAALIGTAIARALNFSNTGGFDWREFLLQVLLAVVGVAIAARTTASRSIR